MEPAAKTPPPWLLATIRACDTVSLWSGKLVAWLIFPMVLSLVYEVIARYIFDAPTTWAYDMTYILYGSFFMLGSAYTLLKKGHIRTDSYYGAWTVQRQGLVDAVCYIVFYFPAMLAFVYVCWGFFVRSYEQGERVVSSPWMPIIYPLKGALFAAIVLLIIQGVSELLKSLWAARHGKWL
jgi:TRAP-type mannitol/chloroaromatic compound transport system permease small subunit